MATNTHAPDVESDSISAVSRGVGEKKVDGLNDTEAAAPSEPAPSYSQEDGVEIDYKTLEWW